MRCIANMTLDEERALYESDGLLVKDCRFDGPADGESALKESRHIQVENCYFNLRYPFWHDTNVVVRHSELTDKCRAALWYSKQIVAEDTKLHGIKALRECADVTLRRCDIVSPEFGWSVQGVTMEDCDVQGEYFMLRSTELRFENVRLQGKYSFQYVENCVLENCDFHTKDAFWHAKNVVVRNSTIRGEYLAWYAENLTFENCRLIGTQPLCYCKGLKLINCEMIDTDLSFEKSEVEAKLTIPILSIKNPVRGHIEVPSVGQIIQDHDNPDVTIVFNP